MDVAEGRQPDAPHGALPDLGKDGVAQLVEALRQDPGQAIGEDHPDRHGNNAGRRSPGAGQRVDRRLVEERDGDVDELAGDEQCQRQHHPRPQFDRIAGPQIGAEALQRAQPLDQPLLRLRQSGDRGPADHARTMGTHRGGLIRPVRSAIPGPVAAAASRRQRRRAAGASPPAARHRPGGRPREMGCCARTPRTGLRR